MAESDKRDTSSAQPSSKAPAQSTTRESTSLLTESVAASISAERTTNIRVASSHGEAATATNKGESASKRDDFTVGGAISADRTVSVEVAKTGEKAVVRPRTDAASISSEGKSKAAAES